MLASFMTSASVVLFGILCIRALYLAWLFHDIVFQNRPVENELFSNWARDRAGIDVQQSLKVNGCIAFCVFVFGCAFSLVDTSNYPALASFIVTFICWFIGGCIIYRLPVKRKPQREGQMC